jgi:two-component system clock-associated histidine kinase SasA
VIIPLLKLKYMQVFPEKTTNTKTTLQLLLFADQRPSSKEQIRCIREFLDSLEAQDEFELQVVDVGEQPHLAEHFKLIATPALVKVYPEPRHTLAGSDLVPQLEHWWPRWQQGLKDYIANRLDAEASQEAIESVNSVAYVSELIKLSDETFRLKQEKEQLQRQLNFKDRIIEILAHDLRSPLTAASLALETLETSENAKDGNMPKISLALKSRLLQQARSQIRTIDRMITDILQTAVGPNTNLSLQPISLDLRTFLEDLLKELQEQFKAKQLRVQTDLPNDIPQVYADPERIRQVIVNLLDNAIKYTPDNGLIQVSLLHRTSQKIQVSICDSGPGVPRENHDRIFQDRFRLQRDECQDGYGIGLSLCRRIIRAHYGRIWVDSSIGQGSCFQFTLPVYYE